MSQVSPLGIWVGVISLCVSGHIFAASPGLPFTEDFTDTALRNEAQTTANWSTEEEALVMAAYEKRFGALDANTTGSNLTTDAHETQSIALGDVDGDGDLDVVAGSTGQANRLYLNNGTADPFNGVTGKNITNDANSTQSIALGDVDGDGDLDVVAGNYNQINRLYLNNGSADPFNGVTGSDITSDAFDTWSLALGDVDGDGDLDIVDGNHWRNRLYLNNGSGGFVAGSNITTDGNMTSSVALGDVDGDGDLDLVAGNGDAFTSEKNRLYLNNGTANPFNGVTGKDLTGDEDQTYSIALGDMDGDGDLDVVAGNTWQANRLYLNNGTADPFNGVTGSDITADAQSTNSIALGDMDGDGDLDVLAGNRSHTNHLYLNNGSADPFNGVTGSEITADAYATFSMALGDVDGDGDLDLLAGNGSSGFGQVNRLYLNNGNGNPFNGVNGSDITADAHNTRSVAIGDVDGDGNLDVVAGNEGLNFLYLNNGTVDPFNGVTGTAITADSKSTRSVALGDVDGDGHLDVVVGNFTQANRLYLNNGTADPFNGVTATVITIDAHSTESIALGDVDGDGHLDVVVGNNNQANRLYLNNGTVDPFNGVTGSDITTDVQQTLSIALGDVDGDGGLDVVAGNNGLNFLYLNNGTVDPFNGVTGTAITADSKSTRSVALGDVDGDGHLDVVVGNFTQANRLYLNNGTADPFNGVTATVITIDAHSTESIALGDVDGDGHLDVVVGNNNQTNRLYLNNGTVDPFNGVTGSDITTDVQQTLSIALGDVDGDGGLDVVAGNDGQANRLYLNKATPNPFHPIVGSDISSVSTESVALGDVDGDGDLDVVAGGSGGASAHPSRLYLNNGTADPFSGVTGSNITTDMYTVRSIALGDMDGDGDLDVVTGNDHARNRLYLNNGTADPFNGVTGSDIRTDLYRTFGVALGDVDGDGDLDVVTVNLNERNRLYLNNGSGVFAPGLDITADAQNSRSVALGDVDDDGDLDVVVGQWGSYNRLYLNNGSGSFAAGSNISIDTHETYSVALGDVNGDGSPDVVAGNNGQNFLYLNNGTVDPFNGVTGTAITADSKDTRSVALGDVDGDGHLDVVAGNYNQANRLYLNDGTGSFVAGGVITADADYTHSMVLGDMDGDGALDVVSGGYQYSRLYRRIRYNTATQRAVSGTVDTEVGDILGVTLTPIHTLPANTAVDYYLSNDGGTKYHQVQPTVPFVFPTTGSDLRWKAVLRSLSPVLTPSIDTIQLALANPAFSVDDVGVAEGHSGTTDLIFNISLNLASPHATSVDIATVDDSAKAPMDYTANNGTVNFAAGETSKTFTVAVKGDIFLEPDETFNVNLSSPTLAVIDDGQGIGTITDDEVDEDDDGVADSYESLHGFDDPDGDADGDGLTNKEEHDAGTSASNPDSDGDGIPDGADQNPLTSNDICTGPDAVFEDQSVTEGETVQCGAVTSVTVEPTVLVNPGGRIEVYAPRTEFKPGFGVSTGAEMGVTATTPVP